MSVEGFSSRYATVGWNIVEGIAAVGAALAAGSVALLGFGVESFVETASGAILIWRLQAEQGAQDEAVIERLDGPASPHLRSAPPGSHACGKLST